MDASSTCSLNISFEHSSAPMAHLGVFGGAHVDSQDGDDDEDGYFSNMLVTNSSLSIPALTLSRPYSIITPKQLGFIATTPVKMSTLELPCTPISALANEILSHIFRFCLPQGPKIPTSYFPSPFFSRPSKPSPHEAPLLLCQISSRWRAIAIAYPALWESLDTEGVPHVELACLWLHRAKARPLSLRISQPTSFQHPIHRLPSMYIPPHYHFPMHLYLPLLHPLLSQCRQLESVDWYMPHFVRSHSVHPHLLESLAVTVLDGNEHAACWFSEVLSRAPVLSKLHWRGPRIAAPWAQLTHLSWFPTEKHFFEMALDELHNLTHLRLEISPVRIAAFCSAPPATFHVLPKVTNFFLCGLEVVRFLILPQLRHLVVEYMLEDPDEELKHLVERSRCTLQSLELHRCIFSVDIGAALSHPFMTSSISHLLIPSRLLDGLFITLEGSSPGTLPPKTLLLRSVDRCFRIDLLAGISGDDTAGALAPVVRRHFPALEELTLYDFRHYGKPPTMTEFETRTVAITGSPSFVVRRSTAFRHEYELWWNSADGQEFRCALSRNERGLTELFEIWWTDLEEVRNPPHPGQNWFANTKRTGYMFV
ncbi:hypothetical protein C8R43DRAFT_1130570 [Mycena crocata]|nr:hypothetical protein C8R43DRAFT_1130570 [Mycena crocata]